MLARLHDTIRGRGLALEPFHALLDAFSQDVVNKRYETFDELMHYCRRSADPVGRIVLALFGRDDESNVRDSAAICSSLQLVNHWQDVAVDWGKGRVYLPREDFERFGIDESWIAGARADGRWRDFLAFQCQRARAMMRAGAPLGTRLPGRLAPEIRAIVSGGLRILERIDAVDGDVFRRRPVLGRADWIAVLCRALVWRPRPVRDLAP